MAKTTNGGDGEDKQDGGDAPLIDLNEASLKKLVARAKKRGYITYDELNEALPQDQMSSEQIEDVMSALNEMGVNVVENEEADEDDDKADEPEVDAGADEDDGSDGERFIIEKKKETVDRTDDPVRMYLREMGAVELLSREGEIAIAKRIEAGRDTMIWGLCESPITFNAIIHWSNALNAGEMQLREILDLDAMLSKGPTPEQVDERRGRRRRTRSARRPPAPPSRRRRRSSRPRPRRRTRRTASSSAGRARSSRRRTRTIPSRLAQMEETLKPQALERFATDHRPLQEVRQGPGRSGMEAMSAGQEFPRTDENKYQKLREQLTAEVESVQFHGAKIEYLVDQLYSYNRRLTALAGQMLRLAERHKVPRRAFLESYMGHELDEGWAERVCGTRQEMDRFLPARKRARSSASAPRSPRSPRRPE